MARELFSTSARDDLEAVRKAHLLRRFIYVMIILPRQARDKHRKNSKKSFFLRAAPEQATLINIDDISCAGSRIHRSNFTNTGSQLGRFKSPEGEILGKEIHLKRVFLRCHFILKINFFTKTGSGRT